MAAEKRPEGYDDVLGRYIRGQRQLADLSLRQLAAMTNVSNAYLSQIERGLHQPSVKVLRSIAGALNLSGETLLVQAGLISPEPRAAKVADAEAAIVSDPDLTEQEKQILVGLYRQFRGQEPVTSPKTDSSPQAAQPEPGAESHADGAAKDAL